MKSDPPGLLPYSHADWWRRPRADDRPPLRWHVASRAFALALWAAPRRHRFAAVKTLAAALTPLVRRTHWYRQQRRLRIDTAGEIALHYALTTVVNSGALFDPEMIVDGGEALSAALRSGRGVLVVLPHALLSYLLIRYLYDIGCVPVILSAAPLVHIYGTRLVAPGVRPSPATVLRLRGELRAGRVVCAMIDKQPAGARRSIEVATPEGPIYISDALIRLAERCGARVVFTAVRLDRRRGPVLTFAAPTPAPEVNAETITADFVRFLQAHLAAGDPATHGARSSALP